MADTTILRDTETELAPNEKRCSKCGEVKDRGEFYTNARSKDNLHYQCRECEKATKRLQASKKRALIDPNSIICPWCGVGFSSLLKHSQKLHGKGQSDLNELGITIKNTDLCWNRKSAASKIAHLKSRKKNEVVIEKRKNRISFPAEYWPANCRYVKVVVKRKEQQIQFNPLNEKKPMAKSVQFPVGTRYRLRIQVFPELLENLENAYPIYNLRKGAGFAIDIPVKDQAIFDLFEFWAKSGKSMVNIAKLTTYEPVYSADGHMCCNVSFADHIWPTNAEYAYFELYRSKRANVDDYIEVYPVTRAGIVANGNKKIDLKSCLKVHRAKNRLYVTANKFINTHLIPPGDWHLQMNGAENQQSDGRLRFRLYKERQSNEQSEDIAS